MSWFQPTATTSIELIERLGIPKSAAVIDIGGGASLLADALLDRGFTDVSVLDVSKAALAEVREAVGRTHIRCRCFSRISWPGRPERRYDLWHDRAVFHFLVERGEQERYLETLRSALGPEGLVIVATFASDGPEYCSGLAMVVGGELPLFLH